MARWMGMRPKAWKGLRSQRALVLIGMSEEMFKECIDGMADQSVQP